MPQCIDCGAYTKYYNGRCYSCYRKRKPRSGKVYIAKVTFPGGVEKIYTGQTGRSVRTRAGEHIKNIRDGNRRTYTGRGTSFKLLGSIYSNDRRQAEKTIKRMPREKKIALAREGARNYKRKRGLFGRLFG